MQHGPFWLPNILIPGDFLPYAHLEIKQSGYLYSITKTKDTYQYIKNQQDALFTFNLFQ